jgi:hypothetical protein
MTQYLLSVHIIEEAAAPDPEQMQRIYAQVDVFNKELQQSGHWVFAGGLHPSTTATVVRSSDGNVVTTDGPFSESKEQLGGFWIVETADLDVALRLAAKGSAACGSAVEVRPFMAVPE